MVRQIASIPGVKTGKARWGVPDIFVVAEVTDTDELNKLVIGKIQSVEGVDGTEMHISIE